MRIRRSVTRFFGLSVLPAISCAVVAYFGYYAIWGERGLLALSDVQARLGVQQELLAQAQGNRTRLEHRIALMRPGAADPDLVEELARSQLMLGGPNQVAVSRSAHWCPDKPSLLAKARRACQNAAMPVLPPANAKVASL